MRRSREEQPESPKRNREARRQKAKKEEKTKVQKQKLAKEKAEKMDAEDKTEVPIPSETATPTPKAATTKVKSKRSSTKAKASSQAANGGGPPATKAQSTSTRAAEATKASIVATEARTATTAETATTTSETATTKAGSTEETLTRTASTTKAASIASATTEATYAEKEQTNRGGEGDTQRKKEAWKVETGAAGGIEEEGAEAVESSPLPRASSSRTLKRPTSEEKRRIEEGDMMLAKRMQEEEELQLAIQESQLQRVREEELQQVEAKELEMAIRQSQMTCNEESEKTATERSKEDQGGRDIDLMIEEAIDYLELRNIDARQSTKVKVNGQGNCLPDTIVAVTDPDVSQENLPGKSRHLRREAVDRFVAKIRTATDEQLGNLLRLATPREGKVGPQNRQELIDLVESYKQDYAYAEEGGDIFALLLAYHINRQGYINRGTCSHPELTSCHVLTSAYVIIF